MSLPLLTGLPLNIYDMQLNGRHTEFTALLRTLDMRGFFYNTVRIDFLRWSFHVFLPCLFACVAVEMKLPVILCVSSFSLFFLALWEC